MDYELDIIYTYSENVMYSIKTNFKRNIPAEFDCRQNVIIIKV